MASPGAWFAAARTTTGPDGPSSGPGMKKLSVWRMPWTAGTMFPATSVADRSWSAVVGAASRTGVRTWPKT